MPYNVVNKKYTLPKGTINFRASACTYTDKEDIAYLVGFYNIKKHRFYGYLHMNTFNHNYWDLTKNIDDSTKTTSKDYLEGMGIDFLVNTFKNKNYHRVLFNQTRNDNGLFYKGIYNKYFKGIEFSNEIEVKIFDYELEIRRLKINKLKLKIR